MTGASTVQPGDEIDVELYHIGDSHPGGIFGVFYCRFISGIHHSSYLDNQFLVSRHTRLPPI